MARINKAPVTFSTGCAIERDYIYLAAKPDLLDEEDEFTRLFFFDAQDKSRPWVYHDLNGWEVESVCVAAGGGNSREYCALSKQGNIEFTWVGGRRIERIGAAGLRRDALPIYGYVHAIRQIGGELYVVGSGGQVYRRNDGQWTPMAEALLKPAIAPASVTAAAGMDIFGKEFSDIDGTSSSDLYVVGGDGEIFHYDGAGWVKCDADTTRPLNCVRAVSANEIWTCGFGGALLRGNARTGFSSAGNCSKALIFSSLGILENRVYLASNKGIFSLSADGIIRRVTTGLNPEVEDANIIDVKDGVLWSFGYKDIVHFGGTRWARLTHPDNVE